MHHVLRAFFQNARKPGGLSGRIMLWAMNWGHASLAKWGRSHVSPEPDARVLDIGCGGGANLAQFLKLCPQGSVCGIDFSAESVATSLRKNAGAVAAGRCEVRQGDVSRLPYADASFDLVTAFETVYFWPDVSAAFAEVFRTVRRVFDRERGVRGFPVVLHSGRDADVYGGRAGGMAARRRICRCPVRRSRRGRGVVPCRKERPGFRCVSDPRRQDATYGAQGGSIPESRGCLHGSLIGPSRFHAFRLMARPRGGRSLRRFCMVFRAAGGLCRRVG